jgi:ABC-2 type transport system ATP-binding protein
VDVFSPLLEIRELRKAFGTFEALRGVSFELGTGERLAFLGPNGAGKTTLIRCLSGLCRPDRGEMLIHGRSILSHGGRQGIGLVPQEVALYGDLTTVENLRAFGRFYGLSRTRLRSRVDWALQWTGLSDRAHHLVGGFSGGMKRRVNLACGVLHRPELLLLDEPTVGVDPQSRQKIFEMLDQLALEGTAILLTTHHLDEAEQRSDRIVIMDHGNVVADGKIDDLVRDSVGAARMVRVRINRPLHEPILIRHSPDEKKLRFLGEAGQQMLSTRIDHVATGLPRLMDQISSSGYLVEDVEIQSPTLHHVFLHLTGHELRDT